MLATPVENLSGVNDPSAGPPTDNVLFSLPVRLAVRWQLGVVNGRQDGP